PSLFDPVTSSKRLPPDQISQDELPPSSAFPPSGRKKAKFAEDSGSSELPSGSARSSASEAPTSKKKKRKIDS
ncbi:hypothetical protein HK097_009765, partial [Rhizophlyctis rosea]